MTQRELAERMGMREQQIQRYEETGYESARYARLMEAHAALSQGAAPAAWRQGVPGEARVMSRVKAAGLEKGFVDDCILGTPRSADGAAAAARERKILSRLGKIYGWTPGRLLGSAPLGIKPVQATSKLSAGADYAVVRAHAVYAAHVAGILAGAARGARRQPPRDDPYRLRADLVDGEDGAVTLPRLVEHSWDAGIAVAHHPPLSFHAAYFGGVDGAGAIVLAREEASESRLMFDLARELWHAAKGRDSTGADGRDTGAEESEADRFAHAVLVGPRAGRMFRACMDMCESGRGALGPARLKQAVLGVAMEEGARADSLANYVAHRLAGESVCNWRGAAQSMQEKMPDWRVAVTAAMLARADLARLSDSDFAILSDVMGNR